MKGKSLAFLGSSLCIISLFLWITTFFILILADGNNVSKSEHHINQELSPRDTCRVKVAMVLCDCGTTHYGTTFDRQLSQTLTLLKSILITTEECVHVLLISNRKSNFDRIDKEIFKSSAKSWNSRFRARLKLEFVPLVYPSGTSFLHGLYRPCATFRLFLPDVLHHHDALIYTDTDFIFLRSVGDLWAEMGKFGPTALAGMVPRAVGYRPRTDSERKKPLVTSTGGTFGFNSGIMLMNLTRMRSRGWTERILPIAKKYPKELKFGDQDMMNIYFDEFPKEMHQLSCDWNFRSFQCHPTQVCENLVAGGISALHGNGLSFVRPDKEPVFRAIFNSFKNTSLNSSFHVKELVKRLKRDLATENYRGKHSLCSKNPRFGEFLLRRLEKSLE